MTNEYKKNILDYITNNVNEESENNVPLFNDSVVIEKYILNQIQDDLDDPDIVQLIIRGYLYDEGTETIAFYGNVNKSYDNKGFVYITDKYLNKLYLTTQFSSGGNLFFLEQLYRDEDNNIYGIGIEPTTTTLRVLLFNNFFIKVNNQYLVRLRKSYIIPYNNYYISQGTIFMHQEERAIIKVPGEATYYLIMNVIGENTINIIRFTINVGSDNEWVVINVPNISGWSLLIEKSGTTQRLYVYSGELVTGEADYKFHKYLIENDECTLIEEQDAGMDIEFCLSISLNDIYMVGYSNFKTVIKRYYNNTFYILEENDSNNFSVNLYQLKDIIIVDKIIATLQSPVSRKNTIGIIIGNDIYYATQLDSYYATPRFMAIYSYNLLILYIASGSQNEKYTTRYVLDYNPTNYNGLPYSNYNQTKAVKGRLYSNGEMVFARNLYNTTLLNNTTTNVLNVPNTLLNDTEINVENLIGATNGVLISNNLAITKNIYETLYINFINTLTVKDEDNSIYYQLAANYITQNINVGSKDNCQNTFIGKVRINYENSQRVQNIVWSWNSDHYETEFTIDATQEVPTLDFISNDDSTIYLTKELNIATGNYYLISQKLRIE